MHDPTNETPYKLIFTSTLSFKVWFATIVIFFATVQMLTALRLYGKIHIPKKLPGWFGDAHRLSGTLAFGFRLPVAYHCLWSLGFASTVPDGTHSNRVLVHSLFGCVLYGAFTIKVLAVRVRDLPGWLLPIVGGTTFAILAVIWTTSSVWSGARSGSRGCDVPAVRDCRRGAGPRRRARVRDRAVRARIGFERHDEWSPHGCADPPGELRGVSRPGGRRRGLGGGAVVEACPDEADEVAVVTNGRGAMPSFSGTLDPHEIQAVVDYTRKDLG